VVAIRRGAGHEIQSGITRPQAAVIEMHPAWRGAPTAGRSWSKETVVLIALKKAGEEKPPTSSSAASRRPASRSAAGARGRRPPVHARFDRDRRRRRDRPPLEGTRVGERLDFAQRDWTVVVRSTPAASGFDSEIWGDAEQLLAGVPAHRLLSSVIVKLARVEDFDQMRTDVDADPRPPPTK